MESNEYLTKILTKDKNFIIRYIKIYFPGICSKMNKAVVTFKGEKNGRFLYEVNCKTPHYGIKYKYFFAVSDFEFKGSMSQRNENHSTIKTNDADWIKYVYEKLKQQNMIVASSYKCDFVRFRDKHEESVHLQYMSDTDYFFRSLK